MFLIILLDTNMIEFKVFDNYKYSILWKFQIPKYS